MDRQIVILVAIAAASLSHTEGETVNDLAGYVSRLTSGSVTLQGYCQKHLAEEVFSEWRGILADRDNLQVVSGMSLATRVCHN